MKSREEAARWLTTRNYLAFLTDRFGGSLHVSKRRIEVEPGSGIWAYSPSVIQIYLYAGQWRVVPALCPSPDVLFDELLEAVSHPIELLEVRELN